MGKIITIILARGGSRGIPKKNIKVLGDKPLIAWTINSALKAGLERVIVSTEDPEIIRVAKEYSAEVLLRPLYLAQDKTSAFEVLQSEVPKIDPKPDIILLLQPTSPFRTTQEIKSSINLLELYDSIVSVEEVPEKWHPSQVFIEGKMADGKSIKDRITRRQDYPKAYTPTGSIYAFKAKNLEQGSIYGEKVGLLITESKININNEEDFKQCEILLSEQVK